VTSTSLGAAELVVPATRDEAVKAFGDGSGVTVFGGGTILMPEINYGRLRPARVLMLRDAGLSGIGSNGSKMRIGAMTTVAELEDAPEPLGSAARNVADHEIRAHATLGGNLSARSSGGTPRGDLQAALIALAATVTSAGKDGERSEPVEDFLADADRRLVLEVELEEPKRSGYAAARRPHAHAYTILAVCAAETSAGVRVGISGAGANAVRARQVEDALTGRASAEDAAHKALDDAQPHDDALASAWYRQRLLPVLVRRALDELGGGQ
jgi:CO/xanthine dehydrogenase FAD-binding subunit